jgi:hypothetical protein
MIDPKCTPRRARVPPIDYRDGLSPCLTNSQETDITTVIQRRRQHPRRTAGRDRSEQVVAIRRNGWSRSSVCPTQRRPLQFKQYRRRYWVRFPSTILSSDFLSIIIGRVGEGPLLMIDDLGWG